MKVLLMSPLEGRDPPSGDTTYTNALLEHPPPGVRYTSYGDALAAGDITIRGRRPRRGSTAVDLGVFGIRAVEHVARGRIMFREPVWWLTIASGRFDLIHQHLFSVKQVGSRLPVVSSAGYPLSVLYQGREQWSARRAARAERLDRHYARTVRSHVPGVWAPKNDVVTVYTERFRQHVMRLSPGLDVEICGQGMFETAAPQTKRTGKRIVFVGRDFDLKGGSIVLEAFELLRERDPDLELVLVTGRNSVRAADLPRGVVLLEDVPHAKLLHEVLPSIDVMLLPTKADCGAPYAVLEALERGVPVVITRLPWLDDRLGPPAVLMPERSGEAFAAAASELLQPDRLPEASAAARRLFERAFTLPVFHRTLLRHYRLAVQRAGDE